MTDPKAIIVISDRLRRQKPGRSGEVTLTLSGTCLAIRNEDSCTWPAKKHKTTAMAVKDIVGCRVVEETSKKNSGRRSMSLLVTLTLTTKDDDLTEFKSVRFVFEAAEAVAFRWETEIMKSVESSRSTIPASSKLDLSKKLVVFVNPKSGDGRAVKMFEKSVKPALQHSGIQFELIFTQRPNHGREFAAAQDLSRWSGLVIVSGDGLLHEIVQGLFERDDWETACKIPLGIVPAGSGNGLCRSLAHINREKYDKDEAFGSVLNLVSGRVRPMDLTRVRTQSGRTFYSFLSIGWGFLADCDIESERLRFLGEPRFTLWAVVRVVNLRHYRGRLHYKPAFGSSGERLDAPDWVTIEDDFVSIYCVSLPWIGTTIVMAPDATLDDGLLHLVIIRKGVTRLQLSNILLELESGKHREAPGVETLPVTAFKLEPITPHGHLTLDGELIEYGPIEAEVLPGCARLMSKS